MSQYIEENETIIFNKQKILVDELNIKQPVIFDVGANIGQSIDKYKSQMPQSIIHSFEPNSETFSTLVNKYKNSRDIYLHRTALSNFIGSAQFHVTNVPEASSLLSPEPELMKLSIDNKYNFNTVDVECETLDHNAKNNNIADIDILKLDVQGTELDVLEGANKILTAQQIKIIYTEITLAKTYTGQYDFSSLLSFLQEKGYQLWDFMPFTYTSSGRLWFANAIFLSVKCVDVLEEKSRC